MRELINLAYFFIAPTIIYRDQYTLTPYRSGWGIVANAVNFTACIYYSKAYCYFRLYFVYISV